jgi:hypothetical protein
VLLYKYRSLENFEYILDIILNERLHCAPYEELNDPFEGIFLSTYTLRAWSEPILGNPCATLGDMKKPRLINPSLAAPYLHGKQITSHKNIEECLESERNKICSLSATLTDVRLWSYYAAGFTGVCFELEVSEDTPALYPVSYSESLPKFCDSPLLSPHSHQVLSCKTNHWEHEQEYRIISENSFFSVTGKLKAIYLGERVSDLHRTLLGKVINDKFPIYRTRINKTKIAVEPNTA